eukprot:UN24499
MNFSTTEQELISKIFYCCTFVAIVMCCIFLDFSVANIVPYLRIG